MRAEAIARKRASLMETIAARLYRHAARKALRQSLTRLTTQQLRAELREQRRRDLALKG